MQAKTSLKYYLLSFLILFTVINTAVAGSRISPAATSVTKTELAGQTKQQALAPVAAESNKGDNISSTWYLIDLSLHHTQLVQTGGSFVGKRTQGDKDLLLLHADNYSKAVKVSAGEQVKFVDSLTHISIFLFPYHFFLVNLTWQAVFY